MLCRHTSANMYVSQCSLTLRNCENKVIKLSLELIGEDRLYTSCRFASELTYEKHMGTPVRSHILERMTSC